ncbi:C39 family peptidase [Bacillus cereus]|uniref:C39 family peptidase n=1 Tax=Bacillus cereus TaxID=1396 RepID=UPI003D7C1D0C
MVWLIVIVSLGVCVGMSNDKVKDMSNKQKTNKKIASENGMKFLDVPLISQKPELMRGCEVTSLAMILQFVGIQVSKIELSQNIKYVAFQNNGLKGNMHNGFVGDMVTFNKPGLGVYVEPILALAKLYVTEEKIINLSGEKPELLYKMVDKGLPVWILTNAQFKELPENQFRTWNTDTGAMKVTYQQHSVVITGYDENHVYVNDPLNIDKNRKLNRNDFEKAWIQMGRQAMTITN